MKNDRSVRAEVEYKPPPPDGFFDAKVAGAEWIELRGFPCVVRVLVDRGRGLIMVRLPVRHRDTGAFAEISRTTWVGEECSTDPARLVSHVRDEIIGILLHELDECLFAHGQRVRDPHAGEFSLLEQGKGERA